MADSNTKLAERRQYSNLCRGEKSSRFV